MQTKHLVYALIALVVMVFGVTYIQNTLGPSRTDDNSTEDPSLTDEAKPLEFPVTLYPYIAESRMPVGHYELEHRKPGYQDYWFTNLKDVPVRLGAVSKSCKCQGVDVYVMPDGYPLRPPISELPPVCALPLGVLGRGSFLSYAEARNSDRDLEPMAEKHVALNPDDPNAEIEVPPKRAGWVRMKWTGEKPGAQNLVVTLWMLHPGSGVQMVLERRATFIDPVRINGKESIGQIRPGNLPQTFFFYVWSSTRTSFDVTNVAVVHPKGMPADADCFVVGKPLAMNTEARRVIERFIDRGRMLSGYQIPLTLQKVAPDGKTPFEQGNFRRVVEVTTDAFDKPVVLTFTGTLYGDIQITGVDESGGVSFGSFPKDSTPAPRVVYFSGNDPDMKLELDRSRTPEFLGTTLTGENLPGGRGMRWKLEVKVLPGVYGTFPRDDDPAYRDSAVYLHTVGAAPQSLRLAVRGDAVDR